MLHDKFPFYGVYEDADGTYKRLINNAAIAKSQLKQEPFLGVFEDTDGSLHSITELGGGGGGMTPEEVQVLIDAALEHKDPIVAAVASASTILFQFSEDGQTFSFLGGTFGWFATHEHYGVVTVSSQIDIPFTTGRLLILDISEETNPRITTKPLSPSITFADNEFVIGNMYREGTTNSVNVVYVYGGGLYRFGDPAVATKDDLAGYLSLTEEANQRVAGSITVGTQTTLSGLSGTPSSFTGGIRVSGQGVVPQLSNTTSLGTTTSTFKQVYVGSDPDTDNALARKSYVDAAIAAAIAALSPSE